MKFEMTFEEKLKLWAERGKVETFCNKDSRGHDQDHDQEKNLDHDHPVEVSQKFKKDHDPSQLSKRKAFKEFESIRNNPLLVQGMNTLGIYQETMVKHLRSKGLSRLEKVTAHILTLFQEGYFKDYQGRYDERKETQRLRAVKCLSDILWNDKPLFPVIQQYSKKA
ncbi:MAG: hypothetical protein K2X66_16095 [Cyanobacteria bacterium]|nr:hypothetical protein [Cyanobacteriota bacterium]